MLRLTAKIGERIRVKTPSGEEVWVVVLEGRAGRAALGFLAPREVAIHRERLILEDKQAEPRYQPACLRGEPS